MSLKLIREDTIINCFRRKLFVDDQFEIFDLEDFEQLVNTHKVTGLQRGTSEAEIGFSTMFEKSLPFLLNTHDFEKIRTPTGFMATNSEDYRQITEYAK